MTTMTTSKTGKLPIDSVQHRLTLAVASGLMLGTSFPPSPMYSLAYVSLIPFLLLMETLEGTWRVLRYTYVTFFIFHALTLYWVGGFVVGKDGWMMIAGGAVLLIHPLFYWPIVLLYRWVRKRLGLLVALVFLPLAWISYEYSHSLSEFSFPWITLGNSQAYDLERIQLAEFTSVYGISCLILCFNVVGFVLITKLATRGWSFKARPTLVSLCCLVLIYFGPWSYGKVRMAQIAKAPAHNSITVGVVQPNIDPWEKWGEGFMSKWTSYDRQLALYVSATRSLVPQNPDLVVWPETAIPFLILLPQFQEYYSWSRAELDSTKTSVLTGLPNREYFEGGNAPPTARQSEITHRYYDDFNSTTLLVTGKPVESVYKKMLLVPFAERIPYAENLKFLIKPLEWNVGIGMWGKGKNPVIFSLPLRDGTSANFASVICFESVYPDFVREFVQRGAQFLVIVTNDSWWGNTSGAYQHASYASIRAVENRRWIVRVANGGISGLIDPTGTYQYETKLYTATTLHGTIEPRNELTFYAEHGDLFAQVCLAGAALLLVLTFIPQRKRTDES